MELIGAYMKYYKKQVKVLRLKWRIGFIVTMLVIMILAIFADKIPFEVVAFINYLTGFNLISFMILFILSLFPLDYKKILSWMVKQ